MHPTVCTAVAVHGLILRDRGERGALSEFKHSAHVWIRSALHQPRYRVFGERLDLTPNLTGQPSFDLRVRVRVITAGDFLNLCQRFVLDLVEHSDSTLSELVVNLDPALLHPLIVGPECMLKLWIDHALQVIAHGLLNYYILSIILNEPIPALKVIIGSVEVALGTVSVLDELLLRFAEVVNQGCPCAVLLLVFSEPHRLSNCLELPWVPCATREDCCTVPLLRVHTASAELL